MSARLRVDVSELDGCCYVKMTGVIDEDNDLRSITDKLTRPVALIGTADVERINSCGVRDWVNWLAELEQRRIDVYLLECSPAMMTQVNLISNFTGHGKIVSFYAPYFCPPPCESDKMLLIDMQEALRAPQFRAPSCRCDECDQLLEFDDLETSYFGFLRGAAHPSPPPEVAAAIRKVSGNDAKPLRSRGGGIKTLAPVPTPPAGLKGRTTSLPSNLPSVQTSGDLRGLLSEVSYTHTPMDGEPAPPPPFPSKLLYIIVGLLSVAIILLAYVILRGS